MIRAWIGLCLFASLCLAQGPAGNEHPETNLVSETGEVQNPFGQPAMSSVDTATKAAFASEVDLEPLRDLAVFHNGRVKILDTLAIETIGAMVGRSKYDDLLQQGDEVEKVTYDHLFTFLDLMIDPVYYVERPLIHVNYLPAREAFLRLEFDDEAEREVWKKRTRLSIGIYARHRDQVFADHMSDTGYRQAFNSIDRAVFLWEQSVQNLLMVAPESPTEAYTHLSGQPTNGLVRTAARDLGAAWRAQDASGVNEAVRTLAAELPTINAEIYPTSRRNLELAYNRSKPFEWGYWMYFVSLLALILAFGTERRWLVATGVVFLFGALALHAFGFGARCIIAERFAIQNQFESMTGVSLFAVLVASVLMLVRRQWLFGAAAAAVGFMVLITATQTGIPGSSIEREAAILNTSVLLKYHVTTVLVSYGLIALGFVISAFYLLAHYMTRNATEDMEAMANTALGEGSRTLRDLDRAQMTVLQLAFWTLGVGILLGAWWADHSWGRWWAFDPKETWALATWIIYLIVIHVRFSAKNRGLTTAWLSLVGFVVMLWTYFGVNLLLPGLHAYA